MANIIYKEASQYSPVIDSIRVADRYDKQISIIANCLSKLSEVNGVFDYLSEITNDNGDPNFLMENALCSLGKVLAAAINYRDEYYAEAADESKDDKDEE